MCTAISFFKNDRYCGRTLDIEYNYNEEIVITPRNKSLSFTFCNTLKKHYALFGVATVSNEFPLYYEAANEKGLFIAGLNFPDNAVFFEEKKECLNLAPFEFIPYFLGKCATVKEALQLLDTTNLVNSNFSEQFPSTPLHWFLSDGKNSYTIESCKDGLHVLENKVGVLTNNPPFSYHLYNLGNYAALSPYTAKNNLCPNLDIQLFSNGLAAKGLPGDFSSTSRFVKAAFVKHNSICKNSQEAEVSQVFHILSSVEQINGCVRLSSGKLEKTLYTCCVNLSKGIYYHTTYFNRQISAVELIKENLDSNNLICYPLIKKQNIKTLN